MIRFLKTPLLAGALLVSVLGASARAGDLVSVSAFDGDFSDAQKAKLNDALSLVNRVLASSQFRDRLGAIPSFTYSQNDGAAVYKDLEGRTYTVRFEGIAKYAFNFFGIKRPSAMVAESSHGSGYITFNTLRMNEFSASFYAGTIAHEICHICTDSSSGEGYVHNGNRPTSSNRASVPYRVGDLVSEIADQLPPAPAAPAPSNPPSAPGIPNLPAHLTPSVVLPPAAPASPASASSTGIVNALTPATGSTPSPASSNAATPAAAPSATSTAPAPPANGHVLDRSLGE